MVMSSNWLRPAAWVRTCWTSISPAAAGPAGALISMLWSREELWKLLVRITMCKVVNTAHRHMADRRDIRRERGDGPDDSSDPHFPKWMLDHVDRSQPSPQERVAVAEEVQRLLRLLPDPLRQ